MSLALPRMLMRRPYRASQIRYFGFGFDEECDRLTIICGVGQRLRWAKSS